LVQISNFALEVKVALQPNPVHTHGMRANVNLDPDAYDFAYAYARGKGIPLGAAISQLLRRAERIPEAPSSHRLKKSPHGYLVIAGTGDVITPEMVKEAAEDELA
jgi:hypothetical protein